MIFQALGSTVRHLTTSAINLSLGEKVNCLLNLTLLSASLPILQGTNITCSVHKNQKNDVLILPQLL